MNSIKAIQGFFFCFLAVILPASAYSQSFESNMKAREGTSTLIPTRGDSRLEFDLRAPDGGNVDVDFQTCVNAAESVCGHGVGGVDHDEGSGSCSFKCLKAPD